MGGATTTKRQGQQDPSGSHQRRCVLSISSLTSTLNVSWPASARDENSFGGVVGDTCHLQSTHGSLVPRTISFSLQRSLQVAVSPMGMTTATRLRTAFFRCSLSVMPDSRNLFALVATANTTRAVSATEIADHISLSAVGVCSSSLRYRSMSGSSRIKSSSGLQRQRAPTKSPPRVLSRVECLVGCYSWYSPHDAHLLDSDACRPQATVPMFVHVEFAGQRDVLQVKFCAEFFPGLLEEIRIQCCPDRIGEHEPLCMFPCQVYGCSLFLDAHDAGDSYRLPIISMRRRHELSNRNQSWNTQRGGGWRCRYAATLCEQQYDNYQSRLHLMAHPASDGRRGGEVGTKVGGWGGGG